MRNLMDMISDRTRLTDSQPDTESTTLAPVVEEAPVITRLTASMDYMLRDILNSPNTSPKVKFMMKKIMEEAMDELRDADPDKVTEEFLKTTNMFYWVCTGQPIQNMHMPQGFWDHVGMIPELNITPVPEIENTPVKELEAGASVE